MTGACVVESGGSKLVGKIIDGMVDDETAVVALAAVVAADVPFIAVFEVGVMEGTAIVIKLLNI